MTPNDRIRKFVAFRMSSSLGKKQKKLADSAKQQQQTVKRVSFVVTLVIAVASLACISFFAFRGALDRLGQSDDAGGGSTPAPVGITYINEMPAYSTNSLTQQCLRYVSAVKPMPTRTKYDYIVVGSGPAGSTLARSFSDAGYKVLLLEAGSAAVEQPARDPPPGMDVPVAAVDSQPAVCNRVLTTAEHVFGGEAYYDQEYTWNEMTDHWTVSSADDVAQGPYTVQSLMGGAAKKRRSYLTGSSSSGLSQQQYMRFSSLPNGDQIWVNPPWGGRPVNLDELKRQAEHLTNSTLTAPETPSSSSLRSKLLKTAAAAAGKSRLTAAGTFPSAEDNPSTPIGGIDFLVTQGRVFGGSSSINYMASFWSSPNLLRLWGKYFPTFGKDAMQAAYKANEHYHGESELPNARGSSGNIHVTPVPTSILAQRATAAFNKALDLPVVQDTNAPQDGFDAHAYELYPRTTTTEWVRSDAVTGMLKGADAANLDVVTDATVNKVMFDSNKLARAVRFTRDGKGFEVQGDKIVLSSGYRSSQLLQLSGIGNKDVLARFGIPSVADNVQVGKNGRNQFMTHFLYTVPGELMEQFNFTGNAGEMGGAFLTSPYARTVTRTNAQGQQVTEKIRDVQILQLAQPVQIIPPNADVPGDKGAYLVYTVVVAVDGETEVSYDITSAAPDADPSVKVDWHNTETKRILWGAQQMLATLNKMANLEPNAALQWKYMPLSPQPSDLVNESTFAAFMRDNMSAMAHWNGGCNLGSVLNADLSVKGVKNLYVADTSIVPFVTSDGDKLPIYDANGVLTIYALAKVASGVIGSAPVATA
jgi:choline dehydrogenase